MPASPPSVDVANDTLRSAGDALNAIYESIRVLDECIATANQAVRESRAVLDTLSPSVSPPPCDLTVPSP